MVYGRTETAIKKHPAGITGKDFIALQFTVSQRALSVILHAGNAKEGRIDREYFQQQMNDPEYRAAYYKMVVSLEKGYRLEISGESREVQSFTTDQALWEFIKLDEWAHFGFKILKQFAPGDPAIGTESIEATIQKEFDQLIPLYNHMRNPE
jgi:hypothetical protein